MVFRCGPVRYPFYGNGVLTLDPTSKPEAPSSSSSFICLFPHTPNMHLHRSLLFYTFHPPRVLLCHFNSKSQHGSTPFFVKWSFPSPLFLPSSYLRIGTPIKQSFINILWDWWLFNPYTSNQPSCSSSLQSSSSPTCPVVLTLIQSQSSSWQSKCLALWRAFPLSHQSESL